MLEPVHISLKKREEEKKRQEQRIQFAMRQGTQPNNTTASDSVTFQNAHHTLMVDALKEVRKNKSTIPDGLYIRPDNHR